MAAAAAYRSGSSLHDERYGLTHDYSRQRPVAHAEIMSPASAPAWVQDRETLWNRVEAAERRKDSQLARAIEVSLPVELSPVQNVALLRDYIAQEFISKGMIADFSMRANDSNNPHAHILLTLREATASGFGPKMRHWNRKTNLLEWRSAWAERANQHLARAGHAVRIDHRTLEAQQIELAPGRKMGVGRGRRGEQSLPDYLQERVTEQQRIAKENGALVIEDPTVALRALCGQRPSFTRQELIQFLRSRTEDPAQLDAALAAILASSELKAITADGAEPARFTSRDLLEAEKSLTRRAAAMAVRHGHAAALESEMSLPPPHSLTEDQRTALKYMVAEGDLKALAAAAGSGKCALLAAAREVWERRGLKVIGIAVSRISAETLQSSSGIPSQTLASQEFEWQEGREAWTSSHVAVVDGAEMIGLKQLERILAVADRARGKVVLVGDAEQLEAMGSMSPLYGILERQGRISLPAAVRS